MLTGLACCRKFHVVRVPSACEHINNFPVGNKNKINSYKIDKNLKRPMLGIMECYFNPRAIFKFLITGVSRLIA